MQKIVLVLFIYLLAAGQHVFAQVKFADSLKNELNKAHSDSARIELLSELCLNYIIIDSSAAKVYCRQLLNEAEKNGQVKLRANAYSAAGTYYSRIGDYNNSLSYYKKALYFYAGTPDFAKTKYRYGKVFHFNGDFKTALSEYLECESDLLKEKDYNTLVKLYTDVADIYMKLNRMDKFESYFDKVKSIIDFVTDTGVGGNASFELGFGPQLVGVGNIGYISWGANTGDSEFETEASYSAVPVMAGVKYYFTPGVGFYGQGQLGLTFFSASVEIPSFNFGGYSYGGGSESASSTEFSFSLGAGYEVPVTPDIKLDFSGLFNLISDANNIQVRAGAKMAL